MNNTKSCCKTGFNGMSGHGFNRAARGEKQAASAAEGRTSGAKAPKRPFISARLKPCPDGPQEGFATASSQFADTLYQEVWDSPFGKVTVCCSEKGVCQLALGSLRKMFSGNGSRGARERAKRQPALPTPAGNRKEPGALLARRAIAELREYASGRRRQFSVPLDLRGTRFQLKVWKALLGIPYGETRSYQQIARQIGNPQASRAVGMANHYNPVAIIVPCHRVISSDGSLGGYAGGLDKKAQMLRLERERG